MKHYASFDMLLNYKCQWYLWLRVGGGHSLLVSLLSNLGGNLDADILDLGQRWIHSAEAEVFLCHKVSQTFSCKQEDRLMDVTDASSDDAKRQAREDISIVTLSWLKPFTKSLQRQH